MSITNFSDITHELNDYELRTLLPIVVSGLKTKIGKGPSPFFG